MKKTDALFNSKFLLRFSSRRVFLPLCIFLICGVFIGSAAVSAFNLFQGQATLPLLFSGIPLINAGFFSGFSTVLLNTLISLIILFLLGVTAFGAIGVPAFIFCKGVAIGIGVLSFLVDGDWQQFVGCVLSYTPVATASSMLFLLFATRALIFSNSLAKAGFSSQQESLNFQFYFRDFLSFLCLAVTLSLVGSFLAVLGGGLF